MQPSIALSAIHIRAASTGSRVRAFIGAARALALLAALCFSAVAQADPVVAQQLLQSIRVERQRFDLDMQIVDMHLATNPGQAQVPLAMAQIDAAVIGAKLTSLHQEHLKSRDDGQYNDLQALERAIAQADRARQSIKRAELRLMTLRMESPPTVFTRALLDVDLQLFELYMDELERAMREA